MRMILALPNFQLPDDKLYQKISFTAKLVKTPGWLFMLYGV
jgi:hypothetical protein